MPKTESFRTQRIRKALIQIFYDGFRGAIEIRNQSFEIDYLLQEIRNIGIRDIRKREVTRIFRKDCKWLKDGMEKEQALSVKFGVRALANRQERERRFEQRIEEVIKNEKFPARCRQDLGEYKISLTLTEFEIGEQPYFARQGAGLYNYAKDFSNAGAELPSTLDSIRYFPEFDKVKQLTDLVPYNICIKCGKITRENICPDCGGLTKLYENVDQEV